MKFTVSVIQIEQYYELPIWIVILHTFIDIKRYICNSVDLALERRRKPKGFLFGRIACFLYVGVVRLTPIDHPNGVIVEQDIVI